MVGVFTLLGDYNAYKCPLTKKAPRLRGFSLSDQVSNLDSSEPKSDVLPVTPSDNVQTVSNDLGCKNNK